MPSTINGIGTSYYGKKNVTKTNGVCEHCKQPSALESYETGHYFVILFVPLVPLGRKQIIDYCPRCSRHRAMPARQWSALKQFALARSTDELSNNLGDASAALQHLWSLSAFGEMSDAKELATAIESQHADSAEPQFKLGAWHEQHGDSTAAQRCFDRAFTLEPQNAIFARAKALGLMQHRELDSARRLLHATQSPTAPDFDSGIHYYLATLYQQAGRDREALELLAILKDRPEMQKTREYRRTVARSEKRLGSTTPMLASVPWLKRRSFWWSLIAIVAITGFLAGNWFLGQNNRLHVVNGLAQDLKIQIDDGPALIVLPEGRLVTAIGEGVHKVKLLEPSGQGDPSEFIVRTPFWKRFFHRPVFLLDPSRTCVVYREEARYSDAPSDDDGAIDVHAGELFVRFPPVDYLFTEFPETLRVDRRRREQVKTRVDFVPLDPQSILNLPNCPPARQLELAEHIVEMNPTNEEDLFGYYIVAKAHDAMPKLQSFLESKLPTRPVAVAVHRLYQEIAPSEGIPATDLVARYDEYLEQEPNNSDLLYLRGRLEFSVIEANKYFALALAQDNDNRHAQLATAFGFLARGEYQAAKERLQKIFAADPEDESVKQLYSDCLVATKEPVAAIEAIRGTWGDMDIDTSILESIKHVATVLELPPNERQVMGTPFTEYERKSSLDESHSGTIHQFYLAYYQRDFARMRAKAERLVKQFEESPWFCFAACIDGGDWDEAVKLAEDDPDMLSTIDTLVLAIALHGAGKSELAEYWFDEGLDRLRREGRAEERMAEFLEQGRTGPVDLDAVQDLRMSPQDKRVFLTSLHEFGQRPNEQLANMIQRFNFDVKFPYYFIRDRMAR